MLNMLSRGTVKLDDNVYRIWTGQSFSVSDFVTYLSPSGTIADFTNSFGDVSRVFVTGSNALILATYMLNDEKLKEIVERRYTRVLED
jgi:hypothetical protein